LIWCQKFLANFRHEIDINLWKAISDVAQREMNSTEEKRPLMTVQGRRHIGKSRFINECSEEADHFLSCMG